MTTKKKFLGFLLVLIGFQLHGQSFDFDFNTIHYGFKEGLESDDCLATAQDKHGYIWVATPKGVFRHDGNKLISLLQIMNDYKQEQGLNAQSLFVDSSNRLWIGTRGQGLHVYDINKNSIRQITGYFQGDISVDNISTYGIHQLSANVIRFTSHSHGLIDYFPLQDSLSWIEVSPNKEWIKSLNGFQLMLQPLFSKENELKPNWYTCLAGIVEYKPDLDTFIYHNPPEQKALGIRSAVIDKQDNIWTATYSDGIYSYHIQSGKWTNYRCDEGSSSYLNCLNAASINQYNDSTLIIGTEINGLFLLNIRTGVFTKFYDELPNGSWPRSAKQMKWHNGILWLASIGNGLYTHNPASLKHKQIFTRATICNVIYNDDGSYIITYSFEKYFKIYHNNQYQTIDIPTNLLTGGSLNLAVKDDSNRLWFASESNLFYFDLVGKKFSPLFTGNGEKSKYENISFRRIVDDRQGHLWASSQDGNLMMVDLATLQYKIFDKQKLSKSYSNYVDCADDNGFVYFKTGSGGMFAYNPVTKGFTDDNDLKDEAGLKFNLPVVIEICTDGTKLYAANNISEIFCLTTGVLEGQTVKRKTGITNLPPYRIRDMKIDLKGRMWMTTNYGLAMINPDGSDQAFYGVKEGFKNLEFIEVTKDGHLIITANREFHILNPDSLNNIQNDSNNLLKSITKHRKTGADITLFPSGIIEMKPKDLSMTLEFDNVNYLSPLKKEYSIKIQGQGNDEWLDLGIKNFYSIQNLDGGKYNVLLKSKFIDDMAWGQAQRLVELEVISPLIKRPIFWIALFTLLAFLIWLFVKWRIKIMNSKQDLIIAFNKQIAETEMKALRAQMNPHFLFNVLNAIKFSIQKNDQDEAVSLISDFSKLIRSVLQNSSKSHISLEDELELLEIYIKIEKKRFSTSFDYQIDVADDLLLSNINIPPLLLQPYVENAIWHGILHKTEGTGIITITVENKNKGTNISIRDNGIGREKANQLKLKSASKNKSMGMQITKDRLHLNNKFSSEKNDITVIDHYDSNGVSMGTEVIIYIHKRTNS